MKSKILVLMLAVVMMVPLVACTVEQTEEGELPNVEVEGGNMPEYDVDAAEVTVGTEEKTIEVPDVDVHMPDEDDDIGEDDEEDGGGGGH